MFLTFAFDSDWQFARFRVIGAPHPEKAGIWPVPTVL
jgi:hypothetical protein